jgi:hypothetical protein
MDSSDRLLLVLKKSLLSLPSVGLLAISCLASWLMHAWWLGLFLAILEETAWVFYRLNDQRFLDTLFSAPNGVQEELTDRQAEEILEEMDFDTRQRLRYLFQLQRELSAEISGKDVPSYARQDLNRIAAQLPGLMDRAVQIGKRRKSLLKYTGDTDERSLQRYCDGLRQKIGAEKDSVTREQYEQALKARETELQTWRGITQAINRIDGQYENLEATLASWKAKVIRIKTADEAGASTVSEGLNMELENLNSSIDMLDASVQEVLAGGNS